MQQRHDHDQQPFGVRFQTGAQPASSSSSSSSEHLRVPAHSMGMQAGSMGAAASASGSAIAPPSSSSSAQSAGILSLAAASEMISVSQAHATDAATASGQQDTLHAQAQAQAQHERDASNETVPSSPAGIAPARAAVNSDQTAATAATVHQPPPPLVSLSSAASAPASSQVDTYATLAAHTPAAAMEQSSQVVAHPSVHSLGSSSGNSSEAALSRMSRAHEDMDGAFSGSAGSTPMALLATGQSAVAGPDHPGRVSPWRALLGSEQEQQR